MAIRIRNTGTEPFEDLFNGERYVIGPGEVAVVPNGAAALWLGIPPEDPLPDERRRAAFRRNGEYPTLVVDKGEPKPVSTPKKPASKKTETKAEKDE